MVKFSSKNYSCFLQEVVGALVTHVGSGFSNEADSSLDVLRELVENHPSDMTPFAIFLKVSAISS